MVYIPNWTNVYHAEDNDRKRVNHMQENGNDREATSSMNIQFKLY